MDELISELREVFADVEGVGFVNNPPPMFVSSSNGLKYVAFTSQSATEFSAEIVRVTFINMDISGVGDVKAMDYPTALAGQKTFDGLVERILRWLNG